MLEILNIDLRRNMETKKLSFNALGGYLLFFVLCFTGISAFSQVTGTINGYVRDAKSMSPIGGISIRVLELEKGTFTDSSGFFRLTDLPTRTFTLEASGSGFRTVQKFDIVVTSGNTSEINFEMENTVTELTNIVVRANFPKPVGVVNSVQSLGIQEIAKYPGANFDMAKVVQSLPGVSGSVGFRNDIIIRGGAPNENAYYLDGVEIPTINHFATQGAAGGPVGMLNVSFIDKVTLHTSAFPAKYDNPLSGVLQFRLKEGNPDKIQGNVRLSASEAAATLEGPLGKRNGKTTFMASVRRSYLQFIFKIIELPFLPDYWDYQYKINHKIDKKNEISIIGLGSIDNFTFNKPEDATLEQLAILDAIPLNTQRTNTIGVSWRHAMPKGYWQLVASKNTLTNTADKFENNEEGDESKRILKYRSTEDENRLRYEINNNFGAWQVGAGAVLIYANYENSTFQRRTYGAIDFENELSFLRYGGYANITRKFFDNRLTITGGVRTDGNNFTETGNDLGRTFSPRLGFAYSLARGLNFNASVGRYYKIPPYTILGYSENDKEVNNDVEYIGSDHFVAGLEWLPTSSIRVTAEGFLKKYSNYPVSFNRGISLANLGGDFGVLGNEKVTSTGEGETYGFELLFQKRLTKHFYGIMAYTYYYSKFSGDDGVLLPSAWDNRHLVSFTGGYKFGKNWEVGVRFRYQGGSPYTPWDNYLSLENYPFISEAVLDYPRLNTLRLESFHAMDLRVDKKFNFSKWSLDLFLDIQNLYNSLNPTAPGWTLKRNPDETIATTTGEPYNPGVFGDPTAPNNRQKAIGVLIPQDSGSRLPSIGFVVEF
jgi:TonB dependent receptor/CarboxypepD_reg-like domain/TonB-dependent Receptor Plug Domain